MPVVPPPVIAILAGGAMWVTARSIGSAAFAFPGQQAIGLVIIAAGLVIDVVSVLDFFRHKTTVNPIALKKVSGLVTTGFYRLSRNPMYLGMLLVLLGWGIILGNLIGFSFLVLFVGVITQVQIKPEERILRELFPDDYPEYCQRVRRWI